MKTDNVIPKFERESHSWLEGERRNEGVCGRKRGCGVVDCCEMSVDCVHGGCCEVLGAGMQGQRPKEINLKRPEDNPMATSPALCDRLR